MLRTALSFALIAASSAAGPAPSCKDWPQSCPGVVPRAPYKQTWLMNLSTIIMPCNNTGYTDPQSTKGWGIVDFEYATLVLSGCCCCCCCCCCRRS